MKHGDTANKITNSTESWATFPPHPGEWEIVRAVTRMSLSSDRGWQHSERGPTLPAGVNSLKLRGSGNRAQNCKTMIFRQSDKCECPYEDSGTGYLKGGLPRSSRVMITKVDNKSPSFSVRTKTSGYQSLSMSCQHRCQNRKAFKVGLQSLPSPVCLPPQTLSLFPQPSCSVCGTPHNEALNSDIPSGEGLKAPKISFLFSISFIKISMSSYNHEQWSQAVLG